MMNVPAFGRHVPFASPAGSASRDAPCRRLAMMACNVSTLLGRSEVGKPNGRQPGGRLEVVRNYGAMTLAEDR